MVRWMCVGIFWGVLLTEGKAVAQDLPSLWLPDTRQTRLSWLEAADRYIREVFTQRDSARYFSATQLYIRMLAMLDDSLSEAEVKILAPHIQALRAIDTYGKAYVSGKALQRWWQRQDPRPSTPQNERLEEHLERWAYAMRYYSFRGQLDDRGLVYICYGPPSRKTSVRLDNAHYRRQVLDREPTLSLSDFSENEFWVYSQIHKDLHFLFIRKKGEGYRIGTSHQLIPGGLYQSPRRVMALLRTLEEIYRQLAIYHIDYGVLYDEIATYIMAVESRIPQSELPSAIAFAQEILSKVQQQDFMIYERQKALRPSFYSSLFDHIDSLAIQLRIVRFLADDSTTRIEVYWSGPVSTFQLTKTQQR